jgi:hypothetical protein
MDTAAISNIAAACAAIGVFAALALLVLAVVVNRRRVTETRLKAMVELAERGAPVPYELLTERSRKPGAADLRTGMVLVFTGGGIIVFAFTLPVHPAWGIGLLPLSAGIGFLVTWMIGDKRETSGKDGG